MTWEVFKGANKKSYNKAGDWFRRWGGFPLSRSFYVRTHAFEITETFERYEASTGTQNSNKAQLTRVGKQATGAEATSAHSLAQTCS